MVEIFYRVNGQMQVSQTEADFSAINIPDVVWIDLLAPTGEEKRAVEAFLGTMIQSRATAEEIESSSRFSETEDAIFANTNFVIPGPEEYAMETVSFILKGNVLTTLREVQLRSFTELQRRLNVFPKMYPNGFTVFNSILEQRIDSDADMIEILSKEISQYNKKVSLGETDSGSERNANQILQSFGLTDALIETVNMNYTDEAEALNSGKIDAIFCTAGIQTAMIEGLAQKCDIRLLSIDETHMEKLLAESDTYSRYTIPAGTYTGQQEDVTTIGVSALLLARSDLDDKTVETLTDMLFRHAQDISYATSLNLSLTPTQAVQNVPIPFHKGAAAYYEKQGLQVTTD